MEIIEGEPKVDEGLLKLRSRREALEMKLKEKCEELKRVCVAEAELTGVLPLETPLEPGESPPKFRKRVGTMFPFTEEVIKNLMNQKVNKPKKHYLSPRRILCPWNKSDTLPNKVQTGSGHLSPNHNTWSHPQRSSPLKKSPRLHPYSSISVSSHSLNIRK